MRALIGYSGFVGGQLLRQFNDFEALYNSQNIEKISKHEFEWIFCAGVPAAKWIANSNPDKDLANINRLIAALRKTRSDKLLLISTFDIYPIPIEVNEEYEPTEIPEAYGRNRLYLEKFCSNNFDTTIIRLPGLFGKGLKKNVIFDMLNNNQIEKINPNGKFQYYNLENLKSDIVKVIKNQINLINFATEPIATEEIADKIFNIKLTPSQGGSFYNCKSIYSKYWGQDDGYFYKSSVILKDLRDFVSNFKSERH